MCRRNLFLAIMVMIGLSAIALPGTAQEPAPPVFATNTPIPAPVIIATPAAALDRYALRLWRADDLRDVLRTRVEQLAPGLSELQKAIKVTQYELARRFPNAPVNPSRRERLLQAMLAAPPGSVDMRDVARPFLETLINQRAGSGLPVSFSQNGFQIERLAANIDGIAPQDAVFHVRYPGAGPVIYEDYLPALVDDAGAYRLVTAPELPAAPGGGAQGVVVMGIGDFSGNGLDELALSLSTGDINNEMRVFGWRGDHLANVVQPGQPLLFGQFVGGLDSSHAIEVRTYRVESAAWGCLGEIGATWRWESNFFRPVPSLADYVNQTTPDCRFYEAEPLFAMPVPVALATISEILPLVYDMRDPAAQRAQMIEVVLRAMNGEIDTALAQAQGLVENAAPGSWLEQQVTAFTAAVNEPGFVQPLPICAAVAAASKDGACDVDAVLARTFAANPLHRDTPLDTQLEALGITVLDQTTLKQIGRAERQVVRFDLAGERWWAFAPLDPEFYTAEQIDPLPGYETAVAPLPVITASQSLYDALLVDDDPATVLAVLDNLLRENPQAAVAPDVRFLQALSLDLVGERTRARQAYYTLWSQSPLSVWGQLAAEHLEQR